MDPLCRATGEGEAEVCSGSAREEGVHREKQAGMSCFNEIRAINYNGEENDLMGKLQRKEALSLEGLGRKRFPFLGFC